MVHVVVSSMYRSASNAAEAPLDAAVITCLSSESVTSPAAKSPGTEVRPSWSIVMYPLSVMSTSVLTSSLTFNAVAGTTYYIAIDGYNGATGNITLNLS